MGEFYSLKALIIEGGFHSSYGEISWWGGWSDNGNQRKEARGNLGQKKYYTFAPTFQEKTVLKTLVLKANNVNSNSEIKILKFRVFYCIFLFFYILFVVHLFFN